MMSLPESTLAYARIGFGLPVSIGNANDMSSEAPAGDSWGPGMRDCADSRFGFGILSLQSATDPQAISEALHWIESAARQGHAGAEELLRKMAAAA
jgi:TPR repeat protein